MCLERCHILQQSFRDFNIIYFTVFLPNSYTACFKGNQTLHRVVVSALCSIVRPWLCRLYWLFPCFISDIVWCAVAVLVCLSVCWSDALFVCRFVFLSVCLFAATSANWQTLVELLQQQHLLAPVPLSVTHSLSLSPLCPLTALLPQMSTEPFVVVRL